MKLIIIVVLFCISLGVNIFLYQSSQHRSTTAVAESNAAYPLLSSRALRNTHRNDFINNFLPLRKTLHQITDPYHDSVAFYFDYLPTGTTIGVNEDSEFTAASLLKVPVVMAYFHKKERLGITADPTVSIQQSELNSKYGDLYKKGAGAQINLGDAVKAALQQSDNTASLILADQISDDDFMYVYEGLDIQPATEDKNPIITADRYVSILRALYYSSILNSDDSEYILDLMSKSEFHDMLPSGVPSDVPVAHKIGLIDDQIYSDCGIIYAPQRPYVLCIISKSDRATAVNRMHDISEAIYDYVSGYENK